MKLDGNYSRFVNFRENFIFTNSIKSGEISDVKNSRLRQDLPISINNRVILPFPEGFIFAKLKFRENKVLAKIWDFTVLVWEHVNCSSFIKYKTTWPRGYKT